jgi:very-short-patch-repair endonuclease
MSLPETLLWRELRKRPGGFKFRRQHPAGTYVLDFFCPAVRLVVEVDGAAHDFASRAEHDERRTEELQRQGLEVLRIPARDVLADVEVPLRQIIAECRARLPLHHQPGG